MILLASVAVALGQAYEPQPCKADADLKAQLAAGTIGHVSPRGPDYLLVSASSLLAPSGARPPDADMDDPEWEEQLKAIDRWTCTYGPTQVVDGDPATAWSEGVDGPGIGEVLIVPLPPGDGPLRIHAGYGKSPERHQENARPRRVEVALLGPGWHPPVMGELRSTLPVLGRHEVELEDRNGWQPLPLPTWSTPTDWDPERPPGWKIETQEPAFVAIRVLSVYEGSRWQDTCISEIGRES